MSKTLTSRIAGVAAAALALGVLAGCSNAVPPVETAPENDTTPESSEQVSGFSLEAYDAVIAAGATADDSTIDANEWASAVRDAGVLKVGGTETSQLFSFVDPNIAEKAVGFDAGLSQLLARYIIGEANTQISQVTADTREEVLVNNTVDAVFATYTINPSRLERINFAGPYFASQTAVLVSADNTDINGIEDLDGKTVATQSSATNAISLIEEFAPGANITELPDNTQALTSVQQGRADAYVIDLTLLQGILANNDDVKIVGEPFGPLDRYGIGVNKENDAVEFINAWLEQIVEDGTWLKLWEATIQAKTGTDIVPTAPEIGDFGF